MRFALGAVVLVLVSCAPEETGAPVREVSTVTVDAVPAGILEVERTLEALGTLRAHERVSVSPEIDGVLESVRFQEGDLVPGDGGEMPVLFELDSRLLDLEVANAEALLAVVEADLAQKRATFERKRMMFEEKATTEAVFTDARLALDRAAAAKAQAQAALDIARERLAKTTIRAPIQGILGERAVSPGDYVKRGEALVEIVDNDPVEVSFSVPERFQSVLMTGLSARCRTDALPEREFVGTVFFVAPDVDPRTRTIRVKATIPNPDRVLRPGLFAKVTLVVGASVESVVVPEAAIVPRGEEFFVYTVNDGAARSRQVRIGRRLPGKVVILEGLDGSETVITAGLQRLSDGVPVRVREEE